MPANRLQSHKVYRANQIIVQHPDWGRRRINAQLRVEFGRGLRDATVDVITRPQREQRQAGILPEIKEPRPRLSQLWLTMKDAGFLRFEIHGVKDSPAKGLGHVSPDKVHPYFRRTLDAMIRSRRREHEIFEKYARDRGWGKVKATRRWNRRILNHYKKGKFPTVGSPVAGGGQFLTPDGKPSPWALFRAWEARLVKDAPFGGDAWGTPRPERRRVKKVGVKRAAPRSKIRSEIAEQRRIIKELDASIARRRAEGNIKMVAQHTRQRNYRKETLRKLEEQL